MKAITYIGVGIGLIVCGFALDRAGVQNWPSNVGKWWDGPPRGSSELALGINEAMEDSDSWRIATKEEKKARNLNSTYEAITNGKLIFTGMCQSHDRTYWSHVHMILPLKGEGNLSECLSASEKVYLFNKAQKVYNRLRYEKAQDTFRVLHEKEQ